MKYRTEKKEGRLMITFSGRMDTVTCRDIHDKILADIGEHRQNGNEPPAPAVIFLMEEVDYVASSFLRLCSAAVGKIGQKNLEIRNPLPAVKKVFLVAGFDQILSLS